MPQSTKKLNKLKLRELASILEVEEAQTESVFTAKDATTLAGILSAFKIIYTTMYEANTSFFKRNFMRDKSSLPDRELLEAISNNEKDALCRTAKQLAFEHYEKCHAKNLILATDMYKAVFQEGIFKRSKVHGSTFFTAASFNMACIKGQIASIDPENVTPNSRSDIILKGLGKKMK